MIDVAPFAVAHLSVERTEKPFEAEAGAIEPTYHLKVRNREPQNAARHENAPPLVEDRQDLFSIEILDHLAGIDYLGAVVCEVSKIPDVLYGIDMRKRGLVHMSPSGYVALSAAYVKFERVRHE